MKIHVDENLARALYDPGANISMINYKYAKKLNKEIKTFEYNKYYTRKTMGGIKQLKGIVIVDIKIFSIKTNGFLWWRMKILNMNCF